MRLAAVNSILIAKGVCEIFRNLTITLHVALLLSCAFATTVVKLELKDITQQAQNIVVGKCVDTYSMWNRERSMIFTYNIFEVSTQIKGKLPSRIAVKVPGGAVSNMVVEVPGAPRFQPGEEAVMFLTEDLYGELRVVGFSQGRFKIIRDFKSGKAYVAQVADEVESVGEKRRAGEPGPDQLIELDSFLAQIKRLIR